MQTHSLPPARCRAVVLRWCFVEVQVSLMVAVCSTEARFMELVDREHYDASLVDGSREG